MSNIVKDLGVVTAYAYAVAGGYTGSEADFIAMLGEISERVEELESLSATATTLQPGSQATASYDDGVITIGVPKGDKGDTGYSPSASVSKSGSTTTITVTDKTGTTTATVSDGATGTTFTPSVSAEGVISWSNDGGKTNPPNVDLAAAVEDVFVVNVSGTDPVIVGEANTRYMCGEVSTLSFTPPQSGTAEVIFTSGSSLAVLTLPNTVKMPEWFVVETNRIYEISITDGVYGAVMSWALA